MSGPTAAQIDDLLNFFEDYRDLAQVSLRSIDRRTHSHRLWEEICTTLNAMGGCTKRTKQWQKPSQVPHTAAAASTCTPSNQEDLSLLMETQTQQETSQQASAPPVSNASTRHSRLTSTRQRRESRRRPESLQAGSSVRDRLFRSEERRLILEEQKNVELAGQRMAVVELCSRPKCNCNQKYKKYIFKNLKT